MQFLHTVHCVIFNIFTANIGIGSYFVYCKYMNRAKETGAKESFDYQIKFDY